MDVLETVKKYLPTLYPYLEKVRPELRNQMEILTVSPKEQIFSSTVSSKDFYVILQGVCRRESFGKIAVPALLSQGMGVWGDEFSLDVDGDDEVRFIAISKIVLLKVPSQVLKGKIVSEFPELFVEFTRIVVSTHTAANTKMRLYNSPSSFTSICAYLAMSYEAYCGTEHIYDRDSVTLLETQEDISEYVNCSLRSVCRTLDKLKEKGYVTVCRGKISLSCEQYEQLMQLIEDWL